MHGRGVTHLPSPGVCGGHTATRGRGPAPPGGAFRGAGPAPAARGVASAPAPPAAWSAVMVAPSKTWRHTASTAGTPRGGHTTPAPLWGAARGGGGAVTCREGTVNGLVVFLLEGLLFASSFFFVCVCVRVFTHLKGICCWPCCWLGCCCCCCWSLSCSPSLSCLGSHLRGRERGEYNVVKLKVKVAWVSVPVPSAYRYGSRHPLLVRHVPASPTVFALNLTFSSYGFKNT